MKLILECDGACRGNPGLGAIGGVINDEAGRVLTEISRFIGKCTNNIAEYQALIAVLECARSMQATQVEVFSDSELMVKQINGHYKVKSTELRALYLQVIHLAASFDSFKISHVLRTQNRRADFLANQAFKSGLTIINYYDSIYN